MVLRSDLLAYTCIGLSAQLSSSFNKKAPEIPDLEPTSDGQLMRKVGEGLWRDARAVALLTNGTFTGRYLQR